MITMRPMLAEDVVLAKLRYPCFVSPKLAGVRGLVIDSLLKSRRLKVFPNVATTRLLSLELLNGLDGELIAGDVFAERVEANTSSAVMSIEGEPDISWNLFDSFTRPALPFWKRNDLLMKRYDRLLLAVAGTELQGRLSLVEQRLVRSEDDLLSAEAEWVDMGYEGICIRSPDAVYKFNRSTPLDQCLLRLKRFKDSEGVVLSVNEEKKNNNPAVLDERGLTKRSTHKANKVGKGIAGSVTLRDVHTGTEVNVQGFTDEFGKWLMENPDKVIGKIMKYQYFDKGVKDKPKWPTFRGFRDAIDMGEPE